MSVVQIFLPIFKALYESSVKYITVGGIATVLHGYPRFTADIDLVIHLEPENCRNAIEALVNLGFRPRAPVDPVQFADPNIRRQWIEEKGLTVFSMCSTKSLPVEIDLFVSEPFDFEDMWQQKKTLVIDGVEIHYVSKDMLIQMKEKSARPKDLEDIEALKKIIDS